MSVLTHKTPKAKLPRPDSGTRASQLGTFKRADASAAIIAVTIPQVARGFSAQTGSRVLGSGSRLQYSFRGARVLVRLP